MGILSKKLQRCMRGRRYQTFGQMGKKEVMQDFIQSYPEMKPATAAQVGATKRCRGIGSVTVILSDSSIVVLSG